MKCIAYISKVSTRRNGAMIPAGLSEIFRVSRKENPGYNITGVLSYRRGYYIQVIEGDVAAVDQLYSNIMLDPRHERVTKIIDTSISRRSFPYWNMKLLQSVNKDTSFLLFMKEHSQAIHSLDKTKQNLLKNFYTLTDNTTKVARTYDGKDLMLSAWPDFTVVKQSTTILELCARLTTQPVGYATLLESGDFGTREELDKILNEFEALEILKISDALDELTRVGSQSGSRDFYSKMKLFLRRR